MQRRTVIAGLAGAATAAPLGAQSPQGSLYIPKPHRVEDRKLLHDFIDEFSFAELVTATPALSITHIPTLLDRRAGVHGTVYGHLSRHNPQSQAIENGAPAVLVFRGPHGYISPASYAKPGSVPTWNFAAVHASARLQAVTEPKALRALLARLIAKHEGPDSAYDLARMPAGYVEGLMQGIIGFSLEIELIEGKFKLGQERSAADRQGILGYLRAVRRERSLEELTAAFYTRG